MTLTPIRFMPEWLFRVLFLVAMLSVAALVLALVYAFAIRAWRGMRSTISRHGIAIEPSSPAEIARLIREGDVDSRKKAQELLRSAMPGSTDLADTGKTGRR